MAKVRKIESASMKVDTRKRVAAYARVSMETELLHHSLSAQISYYSSLIQKNPDWIYAGVYADEGITGTSIVHRDEFNRLMDDCNAGKIDMILVKSISRFTRDTVDCLNTVRYLKSRGIAVYFERERINSLSGDGELLLTLLASFAQAEAESISQNEKWSVKKRFEKGEPNTDLRCFGYDWDPENKQCIIKEDEAKWVRYIYREYLNGASIKGLAADLKEKGVLALRGRTLSRSTIRRILTSETYLGDVVLQRYYSPSIHKPKLNKGEVQQYYVEESHAPLVSREDFEKVQERLNRRAREAANFGYQKTVFAGMVKCGKCGYACNHVTSRNSYGQYSYIDCNKRKTGECDLLPIREDDLREILAKTVKKNEELGGIILFDDHIDLYIDGGEIRTIIREYPKKSYNTYCYTRKLYCGECGAVFVRAKSGNHKVWICDTKKHGTDRCKVPFIREELLRDISIQILGSDENFEMRFYCDVQRVDVFCDRLVFNMKNGEVRVWQRQ